MKSHVAIFGTALILTASAFGQASQEQYHKAKFGRHTPREEARQAAEKANTAYQRETPKATAPSLEEQRHKAKFGRYTAAEEARQAAERASSAYQQEPTADQGLRGDWMDEYHRAKTGRVSPKVEEKAGKR